MTFERFEFVVPLAAFLIVNTMDEGAHGVFLGIGDLWAHTEGWGLIIGKHTSGKGLIKKLGCEGSFFQNGGAYFSMLLKLIFTYLGNLSNLIFFYKISGCGIIYKKNIGYWRVPAYTYKRYPFKEFLIEVFSLLIFLITYPFYSSLF